MKISIFSGISALFYHITAPLRAARPPLQNGNTAFQFRLENTGSASSLADRSIVPLMPTSAVLATSPLIEANSDALKSLPSTIKEAATPYSVIKQIISPLFRLLKKSRPSPQRLTGKALLLTGAALVSAFVVIKFILPYFFPGPAPQQPEPPPAPSTPPEPPPAAPPASAPSSQPASNAERQQDPAAGLGELPPQTQPANPAAPPLSPVGESVATPAPLPLGGEIEPIARPVPGDPSPSMPDEKRASPPRSPSSPSSDEGPSESRSSLQLAKGILSRVAFPTRHFSKWKKYRLIQDLMQKFSSMGSLPPKIETPDPADKITLSWNILVEALVNPDKKKNADEQYRAIILALRETASLLLSAEERVKKQFEHQLKFIKQLSYFRFAGVGLFNYCSELVELVTDRDLPTDLTLANFLQELKSRTQQMNKPREEHSMNPLAREAKKLSGTANVAFDPLLKDNVPYLDGQLGINNQSIRILRHGVPFYHNDPFGLVGSILGLIPVVNRYVNRDIMTAEPVLNADYAAMILEAADRGENILQAILENGQAKLFGDESARVRARLRLIFIYKNFFALALREDGPFFDREYLLSKTAKEPIHLLKERFEQQLLPPAEITKPEEKPLTDEQLLEKMFAHLKETGYCVPEKVIERSELRKYIKPLLQEIEELYFPGCKEIESIPQHQAFIMLSSVHIVLFLCIRLNISILEAFCKDDIDRGNVFKTLLKLHFLYLTGQISSGTLRSILVNTLAAPYIVKKQAIIPSRLVLIEHVVPFLQAAFERTPHPKTFIFGEAVHNPSYSVFAIPGQTIYPDNASAKDVEEYLAFLEAKPIQLPGFNGSLIEETAQVFQNNQIQDLISRNAKALHLRVDGYLLKPRPEEEAENFYANVPWERIIALLTLRAKLPEEEAWKIASCVQLGLHTKLHEQLKAAFDNPQLKLVVELDLESINKNPECGISLAVKDQIVQLRFDLFYKIVKEEPGIFPSPIIARLKASIEIPDHRTGHAQFDWSLIKS